MMYAQLVVIGLVYVLALLGPQRASAATWTAANASQGAVQSALNQAATGDTVLVPAGSASWTGLTLNKAVSLIGAGTNSTIITRLTGGPTITITLSSDLPVRVSGFQFVKNSDPYGPDNQAIAIYGRNFAGNGTPITQLRIDNCLFRGGKRTINPNGWVYGVIDHNVFSGCSSSIGLTGDDDRAWERPIQPGSSNALFVEDNTFYYTDSDDSEVMYHQEGFRSVFRYNTVKVSPGIDFSGIYDSHGNQNYYTGTTADFRGQPVIEIYNNRFIATNVLSGFRFAFIRGGTVIAGNNAFTFYRSNGTSNNIALWQVTEEEGWQANYFNPLRTVWPAQDQLTNSFFYNNTLNGSAFTGFGTTKASDAVFIQRNRDWWDQAPNATNGRPAGIYASYTPYTYPHPLTGGPVTYQPPSTPSNVTPANGATGVSVTPTLTASAYSDPASLSQTASQWRVLSGVTIIYDSGVATAAATKAVSPALTYSTTYTWTARYQNTAGLWSGWSTPTSFTTVAPGAPATPSNTTPANTATDVSLSPTLIASAYSDPQSSAQTASQWLLTQSGTNIIDSGVYLPATTYTIPVVLSNATTYAWRVRYRNAYDLWSAYSAATTFTTTNPPAPPPAPPPLPPPPEPVAPLTPTNVTPASLSVNVTLQLILTATPYSDPQASPQSASQWLVSRSGTNLFDSGTYIATNAYPLSLITLSNFTQYGWQARYRNSAGLWSPYSATTLFTTTNAVTPPAPPQPSTNLPPVIALPPGTNTLIFQGTVILQGTFISK